METLDSGEIRFTEASAPAPIPTPIPTPTPTAKIIYAFSKEILLFPIDSTFELIGTADQVKYFKTVDYPGVLANKIPSVKGLPIQNYPDAFVPCKPAEASYVEVTPLFGQDLTVTLQGVVYKIVTVARLTDVKPFPVIMECAPWYALKGHYNGWNANEGPLAQSYFNAMKEHGITPIKNYSFAPHLVAGGKLDLDEGGASSFRNLVMGSSGNFIFFPTYEKGLATDPQIQPEYLQALEKTIQIEGLTGKAFTYLWDEPNTAAQKSEVLRRAKLMKQYAPSCLVMVTTEVSEVLKPYVDLFIPVLDWFNQAGHQSLGNYTGKMLGLYTSCMAQGCGNHTASGTPLLTIDAPLIHSRIFPVICGLNGASIALYYNTLEAYGNGLDPWKTQYLFGGHGDGTLFYPGKVADGYVAETPIASRRLKEMRKGIQDIQWIQTAGKVLNVTDYTKVVSLILPYKDAINWPKDYAAWENVMDQIKTLVGSKLS